MKTRTPARKATKPTPASLDDWQALLADLAGQRSDRVAELATSAVRRRELAFAAAIGEEEAIASAAALGQRDAAIEQELALLQLAQDRAQSEIAQLELAAAAKRRAAEVTVLAERIAARGSLAAAVEGRLRELAEGLTELDRLSQEISRIYFALGGERLIVAPLDRGAVGSRLSEFCFGLGLSTWLPVACAETKMPPDSFAQGEAAAQAAYRIAR